MKDLPQDQARNLASLTEKAKAEMKNFSLLQFDYPVSAPMYELANQLMVKAAYLFYSRKNVGGKKPRLPTEATFRVRYSKASASKPQFWILEQDCAYLNGCEIQGEDEKAPYLAPLGYCYYGRGGP